MFFFVIFIIIFQKEDFYASFFFENFMINAKIYATQKIHKNVHYIITLII